MADPEPPPTLQYATPKPPVRPLRNSGIGAYGCILFGALLVSFGVSSLITGSSDRELSVTFLVLGGMFIVVGGLARRNPPPRK